MGDQSRSLQQRFSDFGRDVVFKWPWYVVTALFRVLYRFRAEGREHIPEKGPFIVAVTEHSLISTVLSGWISIVALSEAMERVPDDDTVSYLHEELFAFAYFQKALQSEDTKGRYNPLIPHSGGRLSLNLLEGLRALQREGLVVINPEGDATWDGRPVPIKSGAAWLALHSGAPVVPAIVTVGGYDIWPRWQKLPSLRGRLVLRIGEPFTLTEVPLRRAREEDLDAARKRLRLELDRLVYGPEGIDGWAGPRLMNGHPVSGPITLRPGSAPVEIGAVPDGVKRERDLTGLLWRCPVCGTDEALVHAQPLLRRQTLRCRACGTKWEMRRTFERDFRLKVVDGHPDTTGLDMAVTAWYDEMKGRFDPHAIEVDGVDLLPGEEVYLRKRGVPLLPHKPNALYETWEGDEPPIARLPGPPETAQWESIGEGRLLLTNKRLLWQGSKRELSLFWPKVTSVAIWMQNVLGIRYGNARYRFPLRGELPLKWLFYAGTMASRADRDDVFALTLSKY